MLLADVTFSNEAIAVVGLLLSALVTAIVALWRNDVKNSKERADRAIADARKLSDERDNELKSYKEIAKEALQHLGVLAKEKRAAEGKPTYEQLAKVVPEHSSPVTDEQQRAADLQTARAKLVAASLELGMPVREAGPPETEEQRLARLAGARHPPPELIPHNPGPKTEPAMADAIIEADRAQTDAHLKSERDNADKARQIERDMP